MIPNGRFTASYSICDTSLYCKLGHRQVCRAFCTYYLKPKVGLVGRLLGAASTGLDGLTLGDIPERSPHTVYRTGQVHTVRDLRGNERDTVHTVYKKPVKVFEKEGTR